MFKKKTTIRIVQLSLLVLFAFALYSWFTLGTAVNVSAPVNVYIPRGASVRSAVDSLANHVRVPNAWLLTGCARIILKFSSRTVQSGWISIRPNDTQLDLIKGLFSSHRKPSIKVTLPEGLTYREMASTIQRMLESDSTEFVGWCESDSVRAHYNIQSPSMEGYLKPDTYYFYFRESASHICEELHTTFKTNHELGSLHRLNAFERDSVLTLASIVQAEAADISEMPVIAGVYANRLRIGMKLDADPTVQYGFRWKKRVLNRHLDTEHAYNTYVIRGLPPGPINNPGSSAILAALKPARHGYLYFVAKGDGSGQHRFSTTGVEHMANVRKYRRATK